MIKEIVNTPPPSNVLTVNEIGGYGFIGLEIISGTYRGDKYLLVPYGDGVAFSDGKSCWSTSGYRKTAIQNALEDSCRQKVVYMETLADVASWLDTPTKNFNPA